jgi:[ribosomal protein S5]-alanine N-acetyltransferase
VETADFTPVLQSFDFLSALCGFLRFSAVGLYAVQAHQEIPCLSVSETRHQVKLLNTEPRFTVTMQILETSRLILREFTPDDAQSLALVLSDPDTMRFYPAPLDRAGVEMWISRNLQRYAEDGHGLCAMILKSSGDLIGDCGLTVQDVDGKNEIEIGYHVRRDLWGQGLATEAARACRDYGFARLPVERLISLIRPENFPSRQVAEKNGMSVWKEVVRKSLPHLVYRIRRNENVEK